MPNINDRIGSQNVIRVLSNASAPPTRLVNLSDVNSSRKTENGMVLVWNSSSESFVMSDQFPSTNFIVAGVTTFSNTTDSISDTTGAVVTAGGLGVAKGLNVGGRSVFAGISTFNGALLDINGEVNILKSLILQENLNVTGVTTLAGIVTTGGDFYVGGDLYVKDDVVYDEITGRNLNVSGVGTIANLDISGNVNVSGMMTIGSSSITFDGTNDIINVGTGITISSAGGFSATGGLAISGVGTISGGLNATLLTPAQTSITSLGTLTGLTVNGDFSITGATYNASWIKASNLFRFNDNAKLSLGNSDDLQIYHNSNNSFISEVGVGDLRIQSNNDVTIESTGGANSAVFDMDGGVDLYWRGGSGAGKKLEVNQYGAVITGIITATELSGAIDGGSY